MDELEFKTYTMKLTPDQMELVKSAVQLQMRVRAGHGWALVENIVGIGDEDYIEKMSNISPVLNTAVSLLATKDCKIREKNLRTKNVEYDMWMAMNEALDGDMRKGVQMSSVGKPRIYTGEEQAMQKVATLLSEIRKADNEHARWVILRATELGIIRQE